MSCINCNFSNVYVDEETLLCVDCMWLLAGKEEKSAPAPAPAPASVVSSSKDEIADYSAKGKQCRVCEQKLKISAFKKHTDKVCSLCKDSAISTAEFVAKSGNTHDIECSISHLFSVDEKERAQQLIERFF